MIRNQDRGSKTGSEILEVFHLEMTPFRGRLVPTSVQVPRVPRGEGRLSAYPRLRPAALSGVIEMSHLRCLVREEGVTAGLQTHVWGD